MRSEHRSFRTFDKVSNAMKVIMLLFASPLWCDANVNRWMFNQYLPVSLQSFVNYLNLHGVRR